MTSKKDNFGMKYDEMTFDAAATVPLANPNIRYYIHGYLDISRQNVTRRMGRLWVPHFLDFFLDIRLFRAPRRFLEALKTAGDS